MFLFVKGKTVRQDGENTVIELSNEELGRAVLNYIVNNVDNSICEEFMKNLFSGKPMSLNGLLLGQFNSTEESHKEIHKQNVSNQNKSKINKMEENLDSRESKINLLIDMAHVKVKGSNLKETSKSIYEKITKTKNGINPQIMANCDIQLNFTQENVTYSFITYKGDETSDIITPNNNIVLAWSEATNIEIEELINLC